MNPPHNPQSKYTPPAGRPRSGADKPSLLARLRRRLLSRRAAVAGGILVVTLLLYIWTQRPVAVERQAIYPGIVYEAKAVDFGRGERWVRVAEVDLTHPRVELYVTPPEPGKGYADHGYPLRYPGVAARAADLAVAVNGTLFEASGSVYLPGTPSRPNETIVHEGTASHVHPHSYLMWFEKDLTPHIETRKPPPADALAKAHWGISGQGIILSDGVVSRSASDDEADRRTAVGLDITGRRLWLAVYANATHRDTAEHLKSLGAQYAMSLDGGTSSAFYLGPDADAPRTGVLTHRWRPVAVMFGVRVKPTASDPPQAADDGSTQAAEAE